MADAPGVRAHVLHPSAAREHGATLGDPVRRMAAGPADLPGLAHQGRIVVGAVTADAPDAGIWCATASATDPPPPFTTVDRDIGAFMSLSTHVLDTASGRPVPGLAVRCERVDGDTVTLITERRTDTDGRIGDLITRDELTRGNYRLTFATGAWAAANGHATFYPQVSITFTVTAADEHHHVPLLLSPYGYSTYRGN